MAQVLRRYQAPRRCVGQSGSGFLAFLAPLSRKAAEEAAKKAAEKIPEAAGKVVEGLGDRAKKALKGGALVQKNYSLEDQLKVGDNGAGNVLALQALGEPVKGAGFARPPKPKKGVVRTTQATKDARKNTKKTVAALAAISDLRL